MGLYALLSVMTAYLLSKVLRRELKYLSLKPLLWAAVPLVVAVLWYYVLRIWYVEGRPVATELFLYLNDWKKHFKDFVLISSKQIFPMPFTFFMLLLVSLVPLIGLIIQPLQIERLTYYFSAVFFILLYHLAWLRLDHDYYYLMDYQFMVLSWLAVFRKSDMGTFSPRWQKLISILAVAMLIVNVISVRINLGMRYGIGRYDRTEVFSTPYEVGVFWWINDDFEKRFAPYIKLRNENILSKIGIKQDDLIICMPEYTPCTGLYYLDRRGWTDYIDLVDMSKPEVIQDKIDKGAKYAVISNHELLPKDHPIWRFAKDTLYSADKTLIVSLKNPNP